MKGNDADKIRLQHILKAISEVSSYMEEDVDYDTFYNNSEKKFATVKQIEIIGEACNYLSNELKESHIEVPWKSIIGFRNVSIHEYFGLDFRLVWQIVHIDLPELKVQIEKILQDLS